MCQSNEYTNILNYLSNCRREMRFVEHVTDCYMRVATYAEFLES